MEGGVRIQHHGPEKAAQQAAQTAQAVTGARVGAEQENYDRLMKAASVSQNKLSGSPTNTIFQGLSFLGG